MFNKLIRIGKDAELRQTAAGKSVATISGVYDVGWGDNKKSQWIEAALWGKQAESLTQYLTKGKQVVIYADDVCVETYNKKDGSQGFTLRCRVMSIDLTDSKQAQGGQQQNQTVANNASVQAEPRQSPQLQNQAHDSFDDDIPF